MLFWRGWMCVSVLTVRTGWQTWRSLPPWWQPSSTILSTLVPPTTFMSCQALKQPSCTMIELSWRTITSVPLSGEVGHFNYQYSYDLRLYIYTVSCMSKWNNSIPASIVDKTVKCFVMWDIMVNFSRLIKHFINTLMPTSVHSTDLQFLTFFCPRCLHDYKCISWYYILTTPLSWAVVGI